MAKPNHVQQTIYEQMGANKFMVMTGTKAISLPDDNSIRFVIGGGALKRIKYVTITLTSDDLYTMEFGKVHKYEYKELAKVEGLYNDMIRECFISHTGFYTTMSG